MPPRRTEPERVAWDGLKGIDKLLEHRTRLGICVLLSRSDSVSFSRFRSLLEETDGNLGAHLRKLEDAGYLSVRREFLDRKPVTWYALTQAGRRALKAHLGALARVVKGSASDSSFD